MAAWVRQLVEERRAFEVRLAGEDRIAASDDAARLRDGVGVALPVGLPAVFTDPVDDPPRAWERIVSNSSRFSSKTWSIRSSIVLTARNRVTVTGPAAPMRCARLMA